MPSMTPVERLIGASPKAIAPVGVRRREPEEEHRETDHQEIHEGLS
jgi:hypothetical protein